MLNRTSLRITRVLVTTCLIFLTATVWAADRQPNIVVILADDLGYADVGFQGCKDIPTPHIDRLAREGIRFSNGYVTHSFCSPSRAGLLTGRYQQRFGHENNVPHDPDNVELGLPVDEVMLSDVLKKAGYVTGAVGKWHLGAAAPFHPNRRGFTEFFGFLGGGHDYFKAHPGSVWRGAYLMPIQFNGEERPMDDYLTHMLSREAVAFIERNRDQPFFLYLAYNAPHTPMQAPDDYLERFQNIEDKKRRTYAGMVSAMDDGIGEVLAALDALELNDQTLVFFLSDNGGPPKSNASRNDPLRGTKGTVFEGGIRVPFVARWTGQLAAGETYEYPCSALDILPTALAVAGAEHPNPAALDGVDLLPYLTGRSSEPPHDQLFWRSGGGKQWAVRQGDRKLLRMPGLHAPELYDLSVNISEVKQREDQDVLRAQALKGLYDEWNLELREPRWPNPKEYLKAKAKAK